ncbi:MAG: radical SAM protein [Candidatus Omnitrophica bacterium]|nr:radical SAM protein [Candidatus Omnitrophota bacterium]
MPDEFYNFFKKLDNNLFINQAHLEITYRCNLDCVYCYCLKNSNEISTNQFKKIIAQLKDLNIFFLTFSGGEPFLREDFLELYLYAKQKGFLISVLTNGTLFNKKNIGVLAKAPPYVIEITLNAISQKIYQKITQTNFKVKKVLENIKFLKEKNIPVKVKTTVLNLNKDELIKIKNYVFSVLGKPKKGYLFGYDFYIYPKIDGEKTPIKYRLNFTQIENILKKDRDLWRDWKKELKRNLPKINLKNKFFCTFPLQNFVISPTGKLKFCIFSTKFSQDIKEKPINLTHRELLKNLENYFHEYKNSCYFNCKFNKTCFWCPIRQELEGKSNLDYFCAWAKYFYKETKRCR